MSARPTREEIRRRVELSVERRAAFHASSTGRGAEGAIDLPTGILELWCEDLVVRVSAGTTLAALERQLAAHGLTLGIDAPTPERSTLGGILARAEAGRGSAPNDSLRSRLLGLCALDGKARLLKAGARVVKNVAGYDLARLHHGAQGALGIVLDLTLRLSAKAEASALGLLECDLENLPQRLQALRRPALAEDPDRVSWLNAAAAARMGLGSVALLLLEYSGSAERVQEASRASGAAPCSALVPLRDFGADALSFDWCCPLRSFVDAQRRLGDEFCVRADPMSGRHKLVLAAEDAGLGQRLRQLARQTAENGGSIWPTEPWRTPELPTRAHPVAQRLKRAFDPYNLLPPLPEAIA